LILIYFNYLFFGYTPVSMRENQMKRFFLICAIGIIGLTSFIPNAQSITAVAGDSLAEPVLVPNMRPWHSNYICARYDDNPNHLLAWPPNPSIYLVGNSLSLGGRAGCIAAAQQVCALARATSPPYPNIAGLTITGVVAGDLPAPEGMEGVTLLIFCP
jgi:hypothetical protein